MSDSLREQLLKAGFAPKRVDKPHKPEGHKPGKHGEKSAAVQQPKKKSQSDFDLARAYAIRAQTEKAERVQAEREAQKQAQERRERKRRLHELLSEIGRASCRERVEVSGVGGAVEKVNR